MLNVLVKQFDLVALFTYFHAEQVAQREHSYPTIAIDNGEMSSCQSTPCVRGPGAVFHHTGSRPATRWSRRQL